MINRHLGTLLDVTRVRHGERPFLLDRHATLTYREAAEATRRLAVWFRSRGLRQGDRVMIVAGNCCEVALAALAAARIGALFVIIHDAIREQGLAKIVTQVEPSLVVIGESTARLACKFSGTTLAWAGPAMPGVGIPAIAEIIKENHPQVNELSGTELDPVCLVFTSGTTGTPRGIVLNHDNIYFAADRIQRRLGYRSSDIVGLFLPLSFDYGLYQIFLAARAEASIYLGRPESVGPELLGTIESRRVTILPGVPTLFAGLLALLRRSPRALPHLRCLTNTGAHLHRSHVELLHRYLPAVKIFLMYGTTECKRISILLPEELEAKPDSVGRPLDDTQVLIVDEAGHSLQQGQVGEVVVRGRHVAVGYWRAEQETLAVFRPHPSGSGRLLHTGDLGWMDEEGYLYLIGRKDDLFKRRGHRIHPAEIEEAASRIPGLAEVGACLYAPDETLHLFVSVVDATLRVSDVLTQLRRELEPYKIPDKVHLVAELPKTGNGKLDRGGLSRLLAERCDDE